MINCVIIIERVSLFMNIHLNIHIISNINISCPNILMLIDLNPMQANGLFY